MQWWKASHLQALCVYIRFLELWTIMSFTSSWVLQDLKSHNNNFQSSLPCNNNFLLIFFFISYTEFVSLFFVFFVLVLWLPSVIIIMTSIILIYNTLSSWASNKSLSHNFQHFSISLWIHIWKCFATYT